MYKFSKLGGCVTFGSWGNLNSTINCSYANDNSRVVTVTKRTQLLKMKHNFRSIPSQGAPLVGSPSPKYSKLSNFWKNLKKSEKIWKMSVENTERQPLLADPSLDTTLRSKYIHALSYNFIFWKYLHTYFKPLVQITFKQSN